MSMSAPAMKPSGLPEEMMTAALMASLPDTSANTRSNSTAKVALRVLTGSPGTS